MKVLLIAYQFPPLNVGGSKRPLYFAKYLREYGIEPIVVTLDPEDYNKVYDDAKVDYSILDDIRKILDIRYIKSEDLLGARENKFNTFKSIYFNIYRGSEGKYWKADFFKKVPEIIKNEKIEAIFVTAPPFGVLPLAVKLSKMFNLPLTIDMRDAWSLWVSNPYPNYLNYSLTKRTECGILNIADNVIATSKQTIEDFKQLHPSLDKNKFHYIPNGYENKIDVEEIRYKPSDKIKIGYVGSFYYSPESREAIMQPFWKKKWHRTFQYVPRKEDWLYRSPYFFFQSIHHLINQQPRLKNKVEIHFAGNTPDWLGTMINEFGLQEIVKIHGFLNHDDVVSFQEKCDLLLITSAKVLNGKDYSIAGKTFDYFTINKPILAFVCDGAQKDLLHESGMAIILNPDNVDQSIKKIISVFTNGIKLIPKKDFLSSFRRKNLSRELSEILMK